MVKPVAEAEARKQEREARDQQVLDRLGVRIRKLRNQRGLTQERLAERAGLTPKFLGEVERVETNPSATSLVRIAGGLEVGVGDLFDASAEAIPVSNAALKALRDSYQAMGQTIAGLTRTDPSAGREPGGREPGAREGGTTSGGRSRHSRKE